jgi:hypothetical protein
MLVMRSSGGVAALVRRDFGYPEAAGERKPPLSGRYLMFKVPRALSHHDRPRLRPTARLADSPIT